MFIVKIGQSNIVTNNCLIVGMMVSYFSFQS